MLLPSCTRECGQPANALLFMLQALLHNFMSYADNVHTSACLAKL